MSSSTTLLGDRRQQTLERTQARRRHPARSSTTRPLGPPPTAYYAIALTVSVLVMLGLVMVFSASAITSLHRGSSPWRLFNRQMMWAILGAGAMVVCARTPYHRWRRLLRPMLIVAFAMMMLPFLPGIGGSVNDARAWVFLGPVGFQPSEFLKLAVLIYCADLLARKQKQMSMLGETFKPVLMVGGCAAIACLLQGDLGSAIVIGTIIFAVCFIGGTPMTPIVSAGLAGVLFLLAFVVTSPRRYNRFTAFLDITGNRDHLSYQVYQALIGMANGGLPGAGVGGGPSKWGYLPLAHSDFIFAVIGEELGFVGVVAVVGGFLLLTYFGVQVANAARDRFGMLLAGGIATWLAVQALINIGGVSGVMPVTGLTLPFVSSGGSSLFVCMSAAGMLLNVARHVR